MYFTFFELLYMDKDFSFHSQNPNSNLFKSSIFPVYIFKVSLYIGKWARKEYQAITKKIFILVLLVWNMANNVKGGQMWLFK